jgi:uncharacterized protein YegJ (DUF2314 family)
MSWTLDNAEALAAEAPRSFFIPPADLRESLKVGDEVKLVFCLEREDGQTAVERMWVEVVETEPYTGLLRNDPQLSGVIEFGDRVPFAAEHVCAYAYASGELGYKAGQPCSLLKRVAEADVPPPVLLLNDKGEWEAHAHDESESELRERSNVLHWTLGYLTDRFPQTAEALRQGSARRGLLRRRQRGVRWEWQGSRYARVDQ